MVSPRFSGTQHEQLSSEGSEPCGSLAKEHYFLSLSLSLYIYRSPFSIFTSTPSGGAYVECYRGQRKPYLELLCSIFVGIPIFPFGVSLCCPDQAHHQGHVRLRACMAERLHCFLESCCFIHYHWCQLLLGSQGSERIVEDYVAH